MTMDEKTIQAATDAFMVKFHGRPAGSDIYRERVREAMAAALSAAAQPGQVKELEWNDSEPGHINGYNGRRIVESARVSFGAYFIEHSQDDDTWWLVDGLIGPVIAGPFNEAWEARGTAQSDFEAKVKSSLLPTTQAGECRREPAGWRPIKTAPKDGTFIIARAGRWARPAVVHWATYAGVTKWGGDPEDFMEEDHFLQYWEETRYEPVEWLPLEALDAAIPPSPAQGTVERAASLYEFVRAKGFHGPDAKPWTERSKEHQALWIEAAALASPPVAIMVECDPHDPDWHDQLAGRTTVYTIAEAALSANQGSRSDG